MQSSQLDALLLQSSGKDQRNVEWYLLNLESIFSAARKIHLWKSKSIYIYIRKNYANYAWICWIISVYNCPFNTPIARADIMLAQFFLSASSCYKLDWHIFKCCYYSWDSILRSKWQPFGEIEFFFSKKLRFNYIVKKRLW